MRFLRLPKIDFGLASTNIAWDTTYAKMREVCGMPKSQPPPLGCWDIDTNTVYVLRGISRKRAAQVLFHELIHAMVDYYHAAVITPAKEI